MRRGSVPETLPWVEVEEDRRGGAGEIVIRRVAIAGRGRGGYRAIQPGDPFACHFEVEVVSPKRDLVRGGDQRPVREDGVRGQN